MTHRRRLFILYMACLLLAANGYALTSYFLRSQPPSPSIERIAIGIFLQVTFFGLGVLYLWLLPAGKTRLVPGHWLNPSIPFRFVPIFGAALVVAYGYSMFYSGVHCSTLPFPLKGPILCW